MAETRSETGSPWAHVQAALSVRVWIPTFSTEDLGSFPLKHMLNKAGLRKPIPGCISEEIKHGCKFEANTIIQICVCFKLYRRAVPEVIVTALIQEPSKGRIAFKVILV